MSTLISQRPLLPADGDASKFEKKKIKRVGGYVRRVFARGGGKCF